MRAACRGVPVSDRGAGPRRSAPADEASPAADSSSPANGTVPGYAASDSSDIQFRLALLHLYKEASDVVLALPFTTITLTQTAVTRSFIGSGEGVCGAFGP